LIAHAAGVVHHLAQRDGDAEVLQFGNVLVDVVVDGELSLLLKQQDGRGGELLGHGGDVEDGFRSDGDVVIEVRHAVAVLVDDLAVFVDAEGAAGRVGPIPFLKDFVDLGGLAGEMVWAGARQGRGERRTGRRAGRCAAWGPRWVK